MIFSYQSRSSDIILVFVLLRCSILSKMCLVCVIGMLEYMFVIPREAKVEVGFMGVCCSSWISLVVLFILKVFRSRANFVILEAKCVASL